MKDYIHDFIFFMGGVVIAFSLTNQYYRDHPIIEKVVEQIPSVSGNVHPSFYTPTDSAVMHAYGYYLIKFDSDKYFQVPILIERHGSAGINHPFPIGPDYIEGKFIYPTYPKAK